MTPRARLSALFGMAILVACTADPDLDAELESSGSSDASTGDDVQVVSSGGPDDLAPGDAGICDYALGRGVPFSLHGETEPVGDDLTLPAECGDDDGEDVVFSWLARVDGTYRFGLLSADDTATLAVFVGCGGDELLGCAQAEDPATGAEVTAKVEAGGRIAIVVEDGLVGGSMDYVLSISPL